MMQYREYEMLRDFVFEYSLIDTHDVITNIYFNFDP